MNNFLEVLTNGTDDPNKVLQAAQWAIRNGLNDGTAREVIGWALEEFGPEMVYMDGELLPPSRRTCDSRATWPGRPRR